MEIGRGKVILLGEHGVVYGRPALAAALSAGCRSAAEPAETSCLRIRADLAAIGFQEATGSQPGSPVSEGGEVQVLATETYDDPLREPLRRAFCAVLEGYRPPRPELRVQVQRGLPAGAGLGCSAALGVAVVRAVDAALGLKRDAQEVAEASLRWERVFHGNPSGIDSAMAAGGGLAVFCRGEPLQSVAAAAALTLVIGHSGQSSSTRSMVEKVARFHDAAGQEAEEVFDEMAELVLCGRAALESGDAEAVAELMDHNQALLKQLGVSTPRLDQMCRAAIEAGALGAKLTGSGGGGCMLALVEKPEAGHKVVAALKEMGCQAFMTAVGQNDTVS